MTDKQSFLEKLSAALAERGISETDVAPYIEQFDRFWDRMSADSNATESVINNIDGIADNIAAQVSDRYDEINRLAERTMTVQTVSVDTEILDTAASQIIADGSDELELVEIPTDTESTTADDISEDEVTELNIDVGATLPDYTEKEPIKTGYIFWILFAVSLPITVPLALLVLAVFAALWAAISAVIIGAIAALVGLVTIGCAASLIGIIYGISQLFVSVPVGLYEIGIATVIAGVVMFIGILLYNFAVRLMPILSKLVFKLFKFTLAKLKVLFNYLRRESAKL